MKCLPRFPLYLSLYIKIACGRFNFRCQNLQFKSCDLYISIWIDDSHIKTNDMKISKTHLTIYTCHFISIKCEKIIN